MVRVGHDGVHAVLIYQRAMSEADRRIPAGLSAPVDQHRDAGTGGSKAKHSRQADERDDDDEDDGDGTAARWWRSAKWHVCGTDAAPRQRKGANHDRLAPF
ncbi:hypothetical protein [Gandjariella thermophila]|uniref:Uncharacterized protein n=1 Tax=Gandjariella thermophila TaxID=1931992 RepID=A0A4D4J980_9PSEU|nr:hypothetical protein [Gandjariella thermophila]GDY33221.1 hypothetical protein GTS_48540 [Gandjariella thermophila]